MGRQMRSKEKILEELKPQIELVFSLDRELNPGKYKDEARALATLLYKYVLALYSSMQPNYEIYGSYIYEVGVRCIKSYKSDNEKGASFLTYFLNAWNNEYNRIKRDEAIESKPHISEEDKRKVAKLANYVNSKQIVLSATLHVELVAEVLGVSEKKAKELINFYLIEIYNPSIEAEAEEQVIETVPGGISSPEDDILAKVNWHELMLRMEKILNREELHPAVKDILTCDIAGILYEYENYSYDYSFVNKKLLKEILGSKMVPSRHELARKYELKDKTLDVKYSRMMKKLREGLKEEKKDNSEIIN